MGNIRIASQVGQVTAPKQNDLNTSGNRAIFPIKVLDVKGERAIVAVNGSCLEVTSEVSLVAGKVFLVRRLQPAGETERWQLLREVTEENPQSLLAKLGIADGLENKAIVNALGKAGLPITEENLRLIQTLLEKAGGFTHANLMAAITSLKAGIPFELLLPLVSPFIKEIAPAPASLQKGKTETPETNEKQAGFEGRGNTLDTIGNRLKETIEILQKTLSRLASGPKTAFLEKLKQVNNELENEQRRLLGGQLYTLSQGKIKAQQPFYYLPLFLLFREEEYPLGELLVYPQSIKKEARIRLVLNLATHSLGWMRVDLLLEGSSLKVGILVEEQSTRELLDKMWPELADLVKREGYDFIWSGCRVGSVSSFLRDLLEGYFNPDIPKALDLTI